MSDHLHYIEHRHEAGYGVKTIFTCKGDRTSPCHQYPPAELAMERWSDADKHLFVSHDECTWEQWATHADCDTLCGPDDVPVRGGPEPIRVWFEECMLWEYINNETKDTVIEKKLHALTDAEASQIKRERFGEWVWDEPFRGWVELPASETNNITNIQEEQS